MRRRRRRRRPWRVEVTGGGDKARKEEGGFAWVLDWGGFITAHRRRGVWPTRQRQLRCFFGRVWRLSSCHLLLLSCADEFGRNTGTLQLGRRICDELFEKLNNSRTIIVKIRLFKLSFFSPKRKLFGSSKFLGEPNNGSSWKRWHVLFFFPVSFFP